MELLRISLSKVRAARHVYEAREPRNAAYYRALNEVDRSIHARQPRCLAGTIVEFLGAANRRAYESKRRSLDDRHARDIADLLGHNWDGLMTYRSRSILHALETNDQQPIQHLFGRFEIVLGPVDAALAMHLVAPELFPLWDSAIALAYGLGPDAAGSKARSYWLFMRMSQIQCLELALEGLDRNPLKAVDEYNYCVFRLGIRVDAAQQSSSCKHSRRRRVAAPASTP